MIIKKVAIVLLWASVSSVSNGYVQEYVVEPVAVWEQIGASAVAWSPDGQILAVGNDEGVELYTPELEPLQFLSQSSLPSTKILLWSPDGEFLVVCCSGAQTPYPAEIQVWDLSSNEVIRTFSQHDCCITGMGWFPDQPYLLSSSWDSTIRVWDPMLACRICVSSAPEMTQLPVPFAPSYFSGIMSLSVTSDYQVAAVVGDIGLVTWDRNTFGYTIESPLNRTVPSPSIARWSADNNWIATGAGTYNLESQQENNFEHCPQSYTVAWNPNNDVLAIYTDSGVILCDVRHDDILTILAGAMDMDLEVAETLLHYQYALDWSPDGRLLAGAAGDGFVRVWEVPDISLSEE
jgi:WD40 repeat protein